MRLCIVSQQYASGWSGVGTYTRNLVRGLCARGHEVHVVAPGGDASAPAFEAVTQHDIPQTTWDARFNYWIPMAVRVQSRLPAILHEHTFDLIHFTDAREALLCPDTSSPVTGMVNDYYAAWCPWNPVALGRYFSDWPQRYLYYRLQHFLEPRAFARCDHLLANSEFVGGVMRNAYHVDAAKVSVIPYGIESAPDNETESLPGDPSLMCIGGNFQRKGVPAVIRAVALLNDAFPDIHFHVVGHDKAEQTMQALARSLGVERHVTFHGRLDNDRVRRLRATVFVMPSIIEGVGIVFLEAMAAGMPVIGGAVGGTVEVVQDGVNGVTVPPDDPRGVADAVRRLVTDGALRERLVCEGRATVKRYSVAAMAERTEAVFEETAKGHRS